MGKVMTRSGKLRKLFDIRRNKGSINIAQLEINAVIGINTNADKEIIVNNIQLKI